MDDALRRAEAYRTAGADLLLLSPRTPEEIRHIGERLGGPLMYLCKPGGVAASGMSAADLHALGWRLLADPDRKSVVEGMSVIVRVDVGGRRILKKNKRTSKQVQ